MQGFNFNIEYTPKRSRLRTFIMPIIILGYLFLISFFNPGAYFLDPPIGTGHHTYNHSPSTKVSQTTQTLSINTGTEPTTFTPPMKAITPQVPYTYQHYQAISSSNYQTMAQSLTYKPPMKQITPKVPYSYRHYVDNNTVQQQMLNRNQVIVYDVQPVKTHQNVSKFSYNLNTKRFQEFLHSLPTPVVVFLSMVAWVALMMFFGLGMGFNLILVAPVMLMLLFRKKYPLWWYEWNVEVMRFGARIASFAFLLTPDLPDLESHGRISLDIPNPEDSDLSRWLPLIKWLLVLPHTIILLLLLPVVLITSTLTYLFVILFGCYPRPMFNFIEGYLRWVYRFMSYSTLLCTDKYPPFSFK